MFCARVFRYDAVHRLCAPWRGVRVAPYINGRIFDQATQTWARDAAVRFAAKDADPIVGTPQLKTCGRCGAQRAATVATE